MLRNVVYGLLWLLVLIMPWEEMTIIGEMATLSRTFGLLALVVALPAVFSGTPLRPLPSAFLPFALFVIWAVISVFWSLDAAETLNRSVTNTMLLGFVWMIWEFAPSLQRQQWLLVAFFLGSLGPLASEFLGFRANQAAIVGAEKRFTGENVDANTMAATLVISMAIAIYFASNPATKWYRLRLLFWAYVLVAAMGAMLTASRGGFLCLIVLGGVTLVMSRRMNWKVLLMFLVCAALVWSMYRVILPDVVRDRLSEGKEAHTLTVRMEIWQRGLTAWCECPFQGFGSGTFRIVNREHGGPDLVAHNAWVTVLVEEGAVGFILFLLTWVLAFLRVRGIPRMEQMLCVSLLVPYLPLSFSASVEYQKPFWLIFVIILAISAHPRRSASSRPNPDWTPAQMGRPYLPLGKTP